MALRRVLIHRYNNEPDILAVEKNSCSDVMAPGRIDFELLLVIPTLAAKTDIAVIATPASHQYKIRDGHQKHWPGSPGVKYKFRVEVSGVRYTSLARIKRALGDDWVGQWRVKNAQLEENDLVEPEPDLDV